uniref:Ryanodine receptor 3 n=1 Tax=Tetraselmis sp. GSL018 TaxID=582737 RepID=A0A061QY68_9CHLO
MEERRLSPGGRKVRFASLHVFSRIFAQPQGTVGSLGGVPMQWSFEEIVVYFSKFVMQHHHALEWDEEMLNKIIRAMRYACYIDDGRGDLSFIQAGWDAALSGASAPSHMRPAQLAWVQEKYNALGFTHAAVALMTNSNPAMQFEAVRLLVTLLWGGNRTVQDTVCSMLSRQTTPSAAWFSTVHGIVSRCSDFIKQNGNPESISSQSFAAVREGEGLLQLNESSDVAIFASTCMELLRLMCEGHHLKNQMLMLQQPTDSTDVDLVSAAVDLMGELQNRLLGSIQEGCAKFPRLVLSILSFLTEACTGPCHAVQRALALDSALLLLANRMLGCITIEPTDSAIAFGMKARILAALVQLLNSLMEGQGHSVITGRIIEVLDLSAVESQAITLYQCLNGGVLSWKDKPKADGSLPGVDPSQEEDPSQARFYSLMGRSQMNPKASGDAEPWEANLPEDSPSPQAARKLAGSSLIEMMLFVRKLNHCHKSEAPNERAAHMDDAFLAKSGHHFTPVLDRIEQELEPFLEGTISSIEIIWNNRLEKVFFPLTSTCQRADTDMDCRAEILQSLQSIPSDCRENPLQKATKLLEHMDIHLQRLLAKDLSELSWLLWLVGRRHAMHHYVLYSSAAALLLLIVFVQDPPGRWAWGGSVFYIMATVLSVAVLALSLGILASLVIDKMHWNSCATDMTPGQRALSGISSLLGFPMKSKPTSNPNKVHHFDPANATAGAANFDSAIDISLGQNAPQIKAIAGAVPRLPQDGSGSSLHTAAHVCAIAIDSVLDLAVLHALAMTVMAVLAVWMSPLFLAAHLTVFFTEFDAGKTILRALKIAGLPLLETSLVGILAIVIFSIVSFELFHGKRDQDAPQPCETLYQCVATHLITGMYGDFADLYADEGDIFSLVPEGIDDKSMKQLQILFVMAFFILWGFVLSNIFTGLVVDAFAAIRAEEEEISSDNTTRCLVCSLERFEFDKNPRMSFETHIRSEHSPLSYVYYLHYLRKTPSTEYKGYDTFIHQALQQSSKVDRVVWLPISRSITIDKLGESHNLEEESEKQMDLLQYLRVMLQQMERRIASVESQVSAAVSKRGVADS